MKEKALKKKAEKARPRGIQVVALKKNRYDKDPAPSHLLFNGNQYANIVSTIKMILAAASTKLHKYKASAQQKHNNRLFNTYHKNCIHHCAPIILW
eukprot:9945644-Ditylum_brightwellii.AAC.1